MSTEDSDFNVIHLNSRSLQKNYNKVVSNLLATSTNFSIIGVSETWTDPKDDNDILYKINGYNSIFQSRIFAPGHEGGGVALYIKSDLQFKIRHDLMSMNPSVYESLFCEIFNKSKNVIVGVIYRPPGTDIDTFINEFNIPLNKISKSKSPCYIMGDFNINLINADTDRRTNAFLSMMLSMSLTPLIDKPTRITATSATCIDNIFIDISSLRNTNGGIYTTDISDHLPVFCVSRTLKKKDKHKIIETRIINDTNINSFKLALENQNWDFVYYEPDPDRAYQLFQNTYCSLYDAFFPIIRKKINTKTASKPWLTPAILNSIKTKNTLYHKFIRTRNPLDKEASRIFSNKLYRLIKLAERRYYANELQLAQYNMRNTWKILKDIITHDNTTQFPSEFVDGITVVLDNKDIANGFNNYFVNVGHTLASKIPLTNTSYSSYLGDVVNSNFYLTPIVEKEILEVVNKLNNNKSAGLDNISPKVIKSTIYPIVKPLADIFNKSYVTGIVPDILKLARIVPIYKDGDPKTYSNYRPISILSCFSKILERLTYNRLYSYFSKLFNNSQFGFRKNHSTYMALLSLINNISENLDNGEATVGIFLDLSKAFDTIDHTILINKLRHYGIRGTTNAWFSNYLSGRYQCVSINGTKSDFKEIQCGVPQGSILGPILFLIYINDISTVSDLCKFILFADDTNIFLSDRDPVNLSRLINNEFNKIQTWFMCNKLSLNMKKTNYMIFSNRPADQNLIKINSLSRVHKSKFLGVIIDDKLSWNDHISHVTAKVSRAVGILNKARRLLPVKVLNTLYSAIVLPHLQYCNIVWGTNHAVRLHSLFLLQKKAIRIVNNADYLAHTSPLFKQSNQLNLFDINKLQIGTFMYNSINRLLPSNIQNAIVFNHGIHAHNTRHRARLVVPRYRYVSRSFAIAISGPKLWNFIIPAIQNSKTVNSFKFNLKKMFLSHLI